MKRTAFIVGSMILLVAAACSPISKDAKQDMAKPINCATAEGDIRALNSEKDHVGREIAAGVTAIVPIGLVVNVFSGEEKAHYEVATGEYNKMLDKKIAEIKQTCSIK